MKKSIAVVGLIACSPLWAAENLSYNYVELGWIADQDIEIGNAEGDGDGFSISGVFSFTDMLFIQASYADTEAEFGNIDIEGDALSFGVGAHTSAFTGGVDLYGALSYVDIESAGASEDGFGIEIGARTLFTPALEGYISYAYADIGDGDSDGFSLGGVYELTPNWGLGAEYAMSEAETGGVEADADTFTVNVRYNF